MTKLKLGIKIKKAVKMISLPQSLKFISLFITQMITLKINLH
jgi:hypothetical protein